MNDFPIPSDGAGLEGDVVEHQIFWMLVKKASKRDDVGRVYLAIQAAMAYRQETVDVEWLAGAMMAEGRIAANDGEDSIGASGLAYFYWLYEVELIVLGDGHRHQYRFRRRHDGTQILAWLQTADAPRSLQFQQEYERTRRSLEKKRAMLIPNYERVASNHFFSGEEPAGGKS